MEMSPVKMKEGSAGSPILKIIDSFSTIEFYFLVYFLTSA